jgi:hypothetical protein
MLTRDEVLHGAYGAWRLLLGDRRGLDWIDRSPTGAWRSFLLAPLLYPLDLINFGILAHLSQSTAPLWRILGAEITTYAIGWTIFPFLMLGLAPLLSREREVLGYIAVSNWTSAVISPLSLLLALLLWLGILPDGLVNLLFFAQLVLLFVYAWFVARVALNLSLPLSAGLSVLQIVIMLILSQIAFALI